jgi:aspartyl-tRNA(Asn)/glutamyl-tRNA(Gln) amidotransferase subunit A
MAAEDLAFSSIVDLAALIAKREVSPVALTAGMLARIEALDGRLNSFITVMAEEAMAAAETAEAAISAGQEGLGPLHGVPIALKDLLATRGVRTTSGSLLYADWVPDHDAAVVERLRRAGAVILGKTNLHELAYGTTSANPHFGPVHNPWRQGYHPGGSSGGSAAAVAAGLAFMALGSDTGASIRQPAACCGITGLKPTFGRVSKRGCLPLAWSMDHLGPLTRTVEDAALVLNLLAGHDPGDPTSVDFPVPDYAADIHAGVEGMRLGVVRPFFMQGGDSEVMAAIEATLPVFEELGAVVEEVALPDVETAFKAGTMTIVVEGATFHADHLRSRPEAFSPQCKADLELGHFYKATDYVQAQRVRAFLMAETAAVMAPLDALLMPTEPITATPIEGNPADHPVYRVRNTIPFNFLGLPALSVPAGFSEAGLPVVLQIVAKAFDEATLLRIGHAYQQATDWHRRRPPEVAEPVVQPFSAR